MHASVRSCLTAGVATLTAGALVMAPVQSAATSSVTVDTVRLSAAVQPLVQPVNAAAATLGLVDAGATAEAVTTLDPVVQPFNAASDFVINAWNFASYWIGYGSELAQWALGWVWPLNLIGDQAPLLWYNFGLPVGNATVYSLIAPVLNDPLNWSVWSNGISVVAQTVVSAGINTAIAEFDYWFGWILPPLPPLPFPFAATRTSPLSPLASPLAATLAAPETAGTEAEGEPAPEAAEPSRVSSGLGHSKRVARVAEEAPSVAAAAQEVTPAEPEVTDVTVTRQSDRSSSKAEADKGPAGSKETAKPNDTAKKSVGKSARTHRAQKAGD